jgi:hypothetical protein
MRAVACFRADARSTLQRTHVVCIEGAWFVKLAVTTADDTVRDLSLTQVIESLRASP